MTRIERWWTCTPRDFPGDESFFARDSGLLCLGFRRLGVDSRAVLLGERRQDDKAWARRATMSQMECSDWWAGQEIDGVVLYAWGRPEYTRVAEAIRNAGINLVLSQDSGGLVSPTTGFWDWSADRWRLAARWGRLRLPAFILQVARAFTFGLISQDLRRLDHLSLGHRIAVVSPQAVARYRKFFRFFGRKDLADRLEVLPHPVVSACEFPHGSPEKDRVVMAVGRWSDKAQKRPDRLMEVISRVLKEDARYRFKIFGEPTDGMRQWHQDLSSRERSRVDLRGSVDHSAIISSMGASRILLVPSAFESFHIAAGEAVCCGMTIVSFRSASLPSLQWFAADGGGTLSSTMDTAGLAHALLGEISEWETGDRFPEELSRLWRSQLREEIVAGRVSNWFGDQRCAGTQSM